MAQVANRFIRGSAVYVCRSCGRKTRQTGRGDNENTNTCAECFDLGGIENEISDCGSTPELEAEAAALRAQIVKLGGVIR